MSILSKDFLAEATLDILQNPEGGSFRVLTESAMFYDIFLLPGRSTTEEKDDELYFIRQAREVRRGIEPITMDHAAVTVFFNPKACTVMFGWIDVLPSYISPQKLHDLYRLDWPDQIF